jgi:hypothetical protein
MKSGSKIADLQGKSAIFLQMRGISKFENQDIDFRIIGALHHIIVS